MPAAGSKRSAGQAEAAAGQKRGRFDASDSASAAGQGATGTSSAVDMAAVLAAAKAAALARKATAESAKPAPAAPAPAPAPLQIQMLPNGTLVNKITGEVIESGVSKEKRAADAIANNPYLAHLREKPKSKSKRQQPSVSQSVLDDRLPAGTSRQARAARALNFDVSEHNVWSQRGDAMRAEMQHGEQSSHASDSDADAGAAQAPRSAREAAAAALVSAGMCSSVAAQAAQASPDTPELSLALPARPELAEPVPALEWWDAAMLPAGQRKAWSTASASIKQTFKYSQLSIDAVQAHKYIEFPLPVQSSLAAPSSAGIKLRMTLKERKRARRIASLERTQKLQDDIALGLVPKPEPKMKLSNMMRVMGQLAVLDPTAAEAKVREQVAQRLAQHKAHNEANKATPEERHAKHQARMEADCTGTGAISCAAFRVASLDDARHRFKVRVSAKELYLTGLALSCESPPMSVVVVEGGTRAVTGFVRVMTHRIHWDRRLEHEEHDGAGEEEAARDAAKSSAEQDTEADAAIVDVSGAPRSQHCALLWRGLLPQHNFPEWRMRKVATAHAARQVLEEAGMPAFWDLALADAAGAGTTA